MGETEKFSKLRIVQAYTILLTKADNADGVRTVSLHRIAGYEIRMIESLQTEDDAPLFWMELFDHDARASLDSCCCYKIEEALALYQGFLEQVQKDHPND